MNNGFDILKSHSKYAPGWKKAVCAENIEKIRKFGTKFEKYVSNLTYWSEVPRSTDRRLKQNRPSKAAEKELIKIVLSRRKTGFVGMILAIRNAITMYEHQVVEKNYLQYVCTYKFSQDHLKMFLSVVRSCGGYNNNPSCRQIGFIFKRLVVQNEIKQVIGNCIPLETVDVYTSKCLKT